jgi:hypothetical protein
MIARMFCVMLGCLCSLSLCSCERFRNRESIGSAAPVASVVADSVPINARLAPAQVALPDVRLARAEVVMTEVGERFGERELDLSPRASGQPCRGDDCARFRRSNVVSAFEVRSSNVADQFLFVVDKSTITPEGECEFHNCSPSIGLVQFRLEEGVRREVYRDFDLVGCCDDGQPPSVEIVQLGPAQWGFTYEYRGFYQGTEIQGVNYLGVYRGATLLLEPPPDEDNYGACGAELEVECTRGAHQNRFEPGGKPVFFDFVQEQVIEQEDAQGRWSWSAGTRRRYRVVGLQYQLVDEAELPKPRAPFRAGWRRGYLGSPP